MKIYVDADALPKVLKEVLCKAAEREKIECLLVAARMPYVQQTVFVRGISAGSDFNGADDWIAENVETGDLVITADIPLADRVITNGAEALNPHGNTFTPNNIKNAMAMRELMSELRTIGEVSGGSPPFSPKDKEKFTNALNRFLHKVKNSRQKRISVCAAVIERDDGRYLMTARPEGKAHAGMWEFPGGKNMPSENDNDCIEREIREELGIDVTAEKLLYETCHDYPGKSVHLKFCKTRVNDGSQELQALDGQKIAWLSTDEMEKVEILPADFEFINFLKTLKSCSFPGNR